LASSRVSKRLKHNLSVYGSDGQCQKIYAAFKKETARVQFPGQNVKKLVNLKSSNL